jgi:hypothetical protein
MKREAKLFHYILLKIYYFFYVFYVVLQVFYMNGFMFFTRMTPNCGFAQNKYGMYLYV